MRKQSEIKKELATRLFITGREARFIYETLEDIFLEEIKKNGGVRLFNFGKLLQRKMPARKIVGIESGKTINVPAKNRLNFRASLRLKKEINK
jgi:bacterial DNA-binding protein